MKTSALSILLIAGSVCPAQESPDSPGLFERFSESLSLEIRGATFVRNREYGQLGSATVDFSLFSIPRTLANGVFFSGDLSVRGTMGLGTRSRAGNPADPFAMKVMSGGVTIPVLNVSPILGFESDVLFYVNPFYEHALMRNPGTGHTSRLVGLGLSGGLTVEVTDFVSFTVDVSRVQSKSGSSRFLWSARSETIGFGIVVRLGDLLNGIRNQRSVNTHLVDENSVLKQRVARIETERKSLDTQTKRSDDSLRKALAALEELEKEAGALQRIHAAQRAVVLQAASLVRYDESRRAPTKFIRIDKMLFDKEDLVEEEYLKAILSILSNYDSYVWEIAYRDSVNVDGIEGERLAEKIRNFFQIYHSNLNRKLRVVLDSSMKPEFEIRCLGRVLVQTGDSSSN